MTHGVDVGLYQCPPLTRVVGWSGDPLTTIKRELREGTGIKARSWRHLGQCHLSNCFLDERCHLFLAQNLQQGEPEPEGNEALVARRVSLDCQTRSRSRIAVATTGSANTVPHSATLRFDVISMAPVS